LPPLRASVHLGPPRPTSTISLFVRSRETILSRFDLGWLKLHHESKLLLPKDRADLRDNAHGAADLDTVADLESLLKTEMTGHNGGLAIPEFVPITEHVDHAK
jgi:hypothetical protein